mmetsp:Transcript_89275/g.158357  ORF Transcript_89275/g.158357 Transcript_89275/m.158357 type:complete len:398 (-) Transcript_89275:45-1238(-)
MPVSFGGGQASAMQQLQRSTTAAFQDEDLVSAPRLTMVLEGLDPTNIQETVGQDAGIVGGYEQVDHSHVEPAGSDEELADEAEEEVEEKGEATSSSTDQRTVLKPKPKKKLVKTGLAATKLLDDIGLDKDAMVAQLADMQEEEEEAVAPSPLGITNILGRETEEERDYRRKLEARAKRDREYEERKRLREEQEEQAARGEETGPEEQAGPTAEEEEVDDDDAIFSEAHLEATLRTMAQLKQQCLAAQAPMSYSPNGARLNQESGSSDAYLRQLLGQTKEAQLQEDEVRIRVFLRWNEEKERQKTDLGSTIVAERSTQLKLRKAVNAAAATRMNKQRSFQEDEDETEEPSSRQDDKGKAGKTKLPSAGPKSQAKPAGKTRGKTKAGKGSQDGLPPIDG